MRDSQGRTGAKIMKEINRKAFLECVMPEDFSKTFSVLLDIIENGNNKEKLQAIKLLWEYTIRKPEKSDESLLDDFF